MLLFYFMFKWQIYWMVALQPVHDVTGIFLKIENYLTQHFSLSAFEDFYCISFLFKESISKSISNWSGLIDEKKIINSFISRVIVFNNIYTSRYSAWKWSMNYFSDQDVLFPESGVRSQNRRISFLGLVSCEFCY